MPRTKSKAAIRHRKIRSLSRGFKHSARRRVKTAKEALLHAGQYAYAGRKMKKRDYRRLWIMRINAATREHGLTYSQLSHVTYHMLTGEIQNLKNEALAQIMDAKSASELENLRVVYLGRSGKL